MGQGFFNLGPMPKLEKPRKAPKLAGCSACGLDQSGKHEPWYGNGTEGIVILGEAPKDSTEIGGPFLGRKARPLWNMEGTRQFSRNILEECLLGYAIPCPPGEHKLNVDRSQSCKARLLKMIQAEKPKVIVAMGPAAIQALIWDRIGGRMGRGIQATDFIGKCIPDRELNAWIIPTYGLEFLSWQYDNDTGEIRDRVPLKMFQQHLRKAWLVRNKDFPEIPDNIETTRDPVEATSWIEDALSQAEEVALDYETTGIKPHREGHRIVTASLAWKSPTGEDVGKAFQWYGDDATLLDAWKRLMTSDKVKKIAHKNDFEIGWTHERAGHNNGRADYWPENWGWDTCLGAHCIHNEGKVGLKFLTYCELGVIGYDEHVDRYITQCPKGEEAKHGKNAFNHLQKGPIPWDDLLYYNAQDSLFSLRLKRQQAEELDDFQIQGFNLFMEGTDVLSRIHANGLPLDREKALEERENLTREIDELQKDIMGGPEVARWDKGLFNPGSNPQLMELLYDTLKIDPPAGKRNVQEGTLAKIDSPFVKKILEQRKLVKLRDTFLDGILREATWDKDRELWLVRPFFNLSSGSEDEAGGPRTFRSSSDSPNFQNIPKRDKRAKTLIRSLFVAPPGYKFKEYDYKGVEVTGSACYHKDPQMITYLTDPKTDMHRDTCMDLFFRSLKTFTKGERQGAKNGYVFPTFYGATPNSMGPAMWEDMSEDTREHLRDPKNIVKYWDRERRRQRTLKGIKSPEDWMKHVKNVDRKFWNERFEVYGQWKKEEWERLQEDGYLDTFTGFRCYGPLPYTSATNRRIQGSSFHILLQSMIWEYRDMAKRGLASMMCGQIHDAKICLVKEDEEAEMDGLIKYYGAEKIREVWDWIIVPLTIEAEASGVGDTWADMEEIGAL